jgi:hypothetical protein
MFFSVFRYLDNLGNSSLQRNSTQNSGQRLVIMAVKKKYRRKKKEEKPMLFSPLNYKILGLGVLLVIIGFTAMRIENEVYGVVSLYISPVVILAGYIVVIYAILKRDHKLDNPSTPSSS